MTRAKRPENKGLPKRWTLHHGAYYYQVPAGMEPFWDGKKKFRLGVTLHEAHKVWAERMDNPQPVRTIGDLLDQYALQVMAKKSIATQHSNQYSLPHLKAVFGKLRLEDIEPMLVYRYVTERSKKRIVDGKVKGGRTAAMRDVEVLSHAYTKAVEWGYLRKHPFKGEVRLENEAPNDRYVEDWEILEALSLPAHRKLGSVLAVQAYIRIKLMTGMDGKSLLMLTMADIRDDGIHIQRSKTAKSSGKRTIYAMTPELLSALTMAMSVRPKNSAYLFCNRDGKGYYSLETASAPGWKSMWQRFMERVLKETKVVEPFTEHDLRAKCASDAASLEHARALLSHANSNTTRRVYRRKPELVQPLSAAEKSAANNPLKEL